MWNILIISSLAISSSLVSASPLQLTTLGHAVHGETNSNGQTADILDDIAKTKPSGSNTDQSESFMRTSSNPMIVSTSQGDPTADNPVGNTGDTNCQSWFSCLHGVCTGGMSCDCFDGWAGLFCDQQCPSDCAPLGTCETSNSNQPLCVCNETSAYTPGGGCVEKTQGLTTTTAEILGTTPSNMRPLWERDCQGVFTCMYGYCQVSSLTCECDPGWKGQICEQPCDLTCGDHGRCRENQQFLQYCECDNSYFGDQCENVVLHNITTSTAASQTSPTALAKTWDFGDWFRLSGAEPVDTVLTKDNAGTPQGSSLNDAGSNTSVTATPTLRPKAERVCIPGFECKHGYCIQNPLSCVCDRGWGGVFCGQVCDLSCGVNETCQAPLEGSPYCEYDNGDSTGSDFGQQGDWKTTTNGTEETHMEAVSGNFSGKHLWHDLESRFGELPPYEQRFCLPNFICAYGNCSNTEEDGIKCSCVTGFTGVFCQTGCPLECGLNGDCIYNNDNETFECYCHEEYTGVNCTMIWGPVEADLIPSSYLMVMLVCLAAAVLFLSTILLVTVPVILYKRRNIAMMKFVYWFQPFEEDDNRKYDGFVSYASSDQDRQFVLQVLVPKLEGRMCFTLCIHQRNFVPGQFISDNITESVKRSRRTLLIISPSFVSSGWCRFEYQMALQEMLNEKHRVLPIIIGDIKSVEGEIDETLKRILKTVTWLEYPNKNASEQDLENFWKRLQLSMPKKRTSQLESDRCRSCLVSQHSHLSLQSSQDNKILATPTTLTNENANRFLLQRIVQVPASELGSSDTTLSSTSTIVRALESDPDTDSKDGTAGSSSVEIDLHTDTDSQNGTVGSSSVETILHPETDSQNRTVGSSSAEIDLHPDTASKNGTLSPSSAETGPHLHISKPSLAGNGSDGVVNSNSSRLKTGKINDASKNHVSNNLKPDLLVSLQDCENRLDCGQRNELEDIPKCMLDTYLGCIDMDKSAAV